MRGSALVGVMAIITAVLLVGIAIFILGHAEGDIVEYAVDDSRAFYIAEAGLERTKGYLGDLYLDDASADPVGTSFVGQSLGGGGYDAVVVSDASGGSWVRAYEVISTGEIDNVVRQVKATYVMETFSRYQWFIESGGGGYSWFRTGERFEGPVHVNGDLKVDGDPWFGGYVRMGGQLNMTEGSNPTFVRGYEEGVGSIDLPTPDYVRNELRPKAVTGGIHAPSIPKDGYYVVEFGVPSDGWLTYRAHKKNGQPNGPVKHEEISAKNGAAWFESDIHVSGTFDGQMTIGVDGNIIITDDIVYEGSTPGLGPDQDCDDVLGMIAAGHPNGDIIIENNAANRDDVEIHGVMMALQKNIEAEDYQHGAPRGVIKIYGGMLADYSIHLGQYNDDVVISGYARDYNYDNRLFTMPPPFFPFTGSFSVVSWEEVVPPLSPEDIAGLYGV
jgi:hypothetical protein